jgi:AraC-like DNA-binding protein
MEILFVNKTSEVYTSFPLHSHGYWEIIYNFFGSGVAVIGGAEYSFCEGTIFCVPPDVLHRKQADGGFSDGCIFIKDFVPVGSPGIVKYQDSSNHAFQSLFLMAFDIQIKGEYNAEAIICSLGDAMYQLLVSWGTREFKNNASAEAFQNTLLKNIANSTFDLAAEIIKSGYCASYFRKMFKEFTGYSPLNYLNHLRVEYAKKQLQQYHNVRSIKEIALGSGFADPYYFSRIFKQHAGISPRQYVQGIGLYNHNLIV